MSKPGIIFLYVWVVYTMRLCYCIYMSKKFLLYIHAEEFKLETEKSKLVNRLLNTHYAKNGGVTILEAPIEVDEKGVEVEEVYEPPKNLSANWVKKDIARQQQWAKDNTVINEEICQGHEIRWDCGLKNCNQGRPRV